MENITELDFCIYKGFFYVFLTGALFLILVFVVFNMDKRKNKLNVLWNKINNRATRIAAALILVIGLSTIAYINRHKEKNNLKELILNGEEFKVQNIHEYYARIGMLAICPECLKELNKLNSISESIGSINDNISESNSINNGHM